MKKKAIKPISVVAYVHANDCQSDKAYKVEKTQSRFLAQYAKSHNLEIELKLGKMSRISRGRKIVIRHP